MLVLWRQALLEAVVGIIDEKEPQTGIAVAQRLHAHRAFQALKDAKAFARAERDRTYQLTLLQGFFDGLGKYKIANEDDRPMA